MKKLTVWLLLAALIFSFSACGARKDPEEASSSSGQPTEPTEIETTVETSSEEDSAAASEPETTLPEETTEETTTVPEETTTKTEIEELMENMSLVQKVGQLFIIMPEALYPSQLHVKMTEKIPAYAAALTEEMKENFESYPAGGFILFGGNVKSPEQLKSFTDELHSLSGIRPLVCIDEEGGTVARIANAGGMNVPKFGNMQSVAETGDPENAFAVGKGIGEYLAEFGIDLDFAPVADVNTNPDNPVIGRRAFGSDPTLAGEMVAAVIEGLHSEGVGSCIKHFPGHGDTNTDTHKTYAETLKTWEEIASCEMLPFIAGINAGTDMVMAAHIAAPNVTGSETPATLSDTLITEKLRGELGYDGVVTTDSMAMLAVAEHYSPAEAAVEAIKAGVDIILIPDDYAAAFNGVLEAVQSGEITEARIDESVARILEMKRILSSE